MTGTRDLLDEGARRSGWSLSMTDRGGRIEMQTMIEEGDARTS
jgi:hypothetical protein